MKRATSLTFPSWWKWSLRSQEVVSLKSHCLWLGESTWAPFGGGVDDRCAAVLTFGGIDGPLSWFWHTEHLSARMPLWHPVFKICSCQVNSVSTGRNNTGCLLGTDGEVAGVPCSSPDFGVGEDSASFGKMALLRYLPNPKFGNWGKMLEHFWFK